MIYVIGVLGSVLLIVYHTVLLQISTVAEVKDFIDLVVNLGGFGLFVWYLIHKEKRQDRRMEQKDLEITRLWEKLTDK